MPPSHPLLACGQDGEGRGKSPTPLSVAMSATTFISHRNVGSRSAAAARRGVLAMLPLLTGYVPFALVIGSVCAQHGAPLAGWTGSLLIFGGSAHLAAIRTLDSSGVAAAIFTGLLINARLMVYSASLARRWAGQPRWFRIAAAGLIIDP